MACVNLQGVHPLHVQAWFGKHTQIYSFLTALPWCQVLVLLCHIKLPGSRVHFTLCAVEPYLGLSPALGTCLLCPQNFSSVCSPFVSTLGGVHYAFVHSTPNHTIFYVQYIAARWAAASIPVPCRAISLMPNMRGLSAVFQIACISSLLCCSAHPTAGAGRTGLCVGCGSGLNGGFEWAGGERGTCRVLRVSS